jgi:hypothetical protein
MAEEKKSFFQQAKENIAEKTRPFVRSVEHGADRLEMTAHRAEHAIANEAHKIENGAVHLEHAAADKIHRAEHSVESSYEAGKAKFDKFVGNEKGGDGGPNVLQGVLDRYKKQGRDRMNEQIDLGDPGSGKHAPDTYEKTVRPQQDRAYKAASKGAEIFQEKFGRDLNTMANPSASPVACGRAMVSVMKNVQELSTPEGLAKAGAEEALKIFAEKDKRVEKVLEAGKLGKEGKEALEDLHKIKEDITKKDYTALAKDSHDFDQKWKSISEHLPAQNERAQSAHARHVENGVGGR